MNLDRNAITVTELTELVGVSESTIRRDLNALDKQGKLNKVRGGATAIEQEFITSEASVSVKKQMNVEEKKAIARYAATMINDERVLNQSYHRID